MVTVQWLLDTFHGGRLLSEAGYLHPESLPPAPPAVSVPAQSASTSRASAVPPAASPPTPTHARAEEDLLSQYMDDDQTVGRLLKNLNGMRNIHFFITASLLPPLIRQLTGIHQQRATAVQRWSLSLNYGNQSRAENQSQNSACRKPAGRDCFLENASSLWA